MLSGWTSSEPASALCLPLPLLPPFPLPVVECCAPFSNHPTPLQPSLVVFAWLVAEMLSKQWLIYFLLTTPTLTLKISPLSWITCVHCSGQILSVHFNFSCFFFSVLTQSQRGQHQFTQLGSQSSLNADSTHTHTHTHTDTHTHTHSYTQHTLRIPSVWVNTDKAPIACSHFLSHHPKQKEKSLLDTLVNIV